MFVCYARYDGARWLLREVSDNQWGPSRALLEHEDPYALALNSQKSTPFIMFQQPVYPVSGLVFLWPIAIWDWPVAKAIWAFSNLVFTAIILFSLFSLFPEGTTNSTKVLLSLVFLTSTYWRFCVIKGQHSLFSLAFFLLSIYLLRRDSFGCGLSLAVSWFKVQYNVSPILVLFCDPRER